MIVVRCTRCGRTVTLTPTTLGPDGQPAPEHLWSLAGRLTGLARWMRGRSRR